MRFNTFKSVGRAGVITWFLSAGDGVRTTGRVVIGCVAMVMSAACNFSDTEVPRNAGDPCTVQGQRDAQLECVDGVWQTVPQMTDLDLGMPDSSTADQPEDMPCVAESDDELCTNLNRCAVNISVVDTCGTLRTIRCPDSCQSGFCLEATGLCEGTCTPKMCPSDVMCGRVSNGCGAMQICDQCGEGTSCDLDAGACACDPPDPALHCTTVCGEIMAPDQCGKNVLFDCGGCRQGGLCEGNTCNQLTELVSASPAMGERFGQALSLDGDLLAVGAPGGVYPGYVGRVEVMTRGGASRSWMTQADTHEQPLSDSLIVSYNDHTLGTSIAAHDAKGFVLLGKSLDEGQEGANNFVSLLVRSGDSWGEGNALTVDTDGLDDNSGGAPVAVFGDYAAISAPTAGGGAGVVRVYALSGTLAPKGFKDFVGTSPEDSAGVSVALADARLLYGAPGYDGGKGACFVARESSKAAELWGEEERIEPHDPTTGKAFCQHVALLPNRFAASFHGRVGADGVTRDVVQVFASKDNGLTWDFQQEIPDPQPGSDGGFGSSIDFADNGTLVIGDPLQSLGSSTQAGAAYVYVLAGDTYTLDQEARSNSPVANGHFGAAVAIQGSTVLVGAPGESVTEMPEAGVVYYFDR